LGKKGGNWRKWGQLNGQRRKGLRDKSAEIKGLNKGERYEKKTTTPHEKKRKKRLRKKKGLGFINQ